MPPACLKKKAYETRSQADKAANKSGFKLWSYFCVWCRKWHLSKIHPKEIKQHRL